MDNRHEAAARQLVGNLSKERTAELAKARQEAGAAREEGEALRAKLEAALARRRAVEAEVGRAGGADMLRALVQAWCKPGAGAGLRGLQQTHGGDVTVSLMVGHWCDGATCCCSSRQHSSRACAACCGPARCARVVCRQRADHSPAACHLQLTNLKEKLAVVLNKTTNDDRLIAALHAELAAARQGGSRSVARVLTDMAACNAQLSLRHAGSLQPLTHSLPVA